MERAPNMTTGPERLVTEPDVPADGKTAGTAKGNDGVPLHSTPSGDQPVSVDSLVPRFETSFTFPSSHANVVSGSLPDRDSPSPLPSPANPLLQSGEAITITVLQGPRPKGAIGALAGKESVESETGNGVAGEGAVVSEQAEPVVFSLGSTAHTPAREQSVAEKPEQKAQSSATSRAPQEAQENVVQGAGRDSGERQVTASSTVLNKEGERSVAAEHQTKIQVQDPGSMHGAPDLNQARAAQGILAPQPAAASAARPTDFIFQLAERMQVQIQAGGGELRLQLKPENLGQLEIRAESGASGLIARIVTESEAVKHYLENNLQTLHQSLQDQGLKIDRIEVALQDGFEARQFAGQQQSNHAGQQHAHHEAGRSMTESASSALEKEIISASGIQPTFGSNGRFHTVA